MNKFYKIGLLGFFIISAITFSSSKVKAAAVSPDKYYIETTDSTPITQKLLVYGNPTSTKPITMYLGVYGMRKVGEENDREFFVPDITNPYEPANWIKLTQSQISVGPTETVEVVWSVTPSEFTPCGTSYAGIVVSENALPTFDPKGESVVSFKNEVISQVHINVTKKKNDDCQNNSVKLGLLEFKVDANIPLFNYDNVPFLTRIRNDGNLISVQPMGFIELFGFGEKITIPFNQDALDIYPLTTRKFQNEWIDKDYPHDKGFFDQVIYEATHLRIGQYEARLGVTKNVSPQIVAKATFWIIPWRLILVLLVLLIVILIPLWYSRRESRLANKYKKMLSNKNGSQFY